MIYITKIGRVVDNMAGFRLPSNGNKSTIDLADYGGEGKLVIKPITVNDSSKLSEQLFEQARKDGIEVKTVKELENLIADRYSLKTMLFYIKNNVRADDDGTLRELTEEEIDSLPSELFLEIMKVLKRGSDFPLTQKGGKAQK